MFTNSSMSSFGSDQSKSATISLSPGDLDEAIEVFVQFGADGGLGKAGTVFAAVNALGQGVIQEAKSCGVG